jgi:hypothetical protein
LKIPKNVAASIRRRLLNLSRERGEEFGLILTRYGLERLLYRLSLSDHHNEFVLKGAMLFEVWMHVAHRSTRDLDLLGRGDPSLERCTAVFRELCSVPVTDDGLVFFPESAHAQRIKEDQEYEGIRIKLLCNLENARIPLQIDVGFGDAVTPPPTTLDYPTLLDLPVLDSKPTHERASFQKSYRR